MLKITGDQRRHCHDIKDLNRQFLEHVAIPQEYVYLYNCLLYGKATIKDQNAVLKSLIPSIIIRFAVNVPGANIIECQKAISDPEWSLHFFRIIPNSCIQIAINKCGGTEFEDELNALIMHRALF